MRFATACIAAVNATESGPAAAGDQHAFARAERRRCARSRVRRRARARASHDRRTCAAISRSTSRFATAARLSQSFLPRDETELNLGDAAREVEAQRHDRQAFFGDAGSAAARSPLYAAAACAAASARRSRNCPACTAECACPSSHASPSRKRAYASAKLAPPARTRFHLGSGQAPSRPRAIRGCGTRSARGDYRSWARCSSLEEPDCGGRRRLQACRAKRNFPRRARARCRRRRERSLRRRARCGAAR